MPEAEELGNGALRAARVQGKMGGLEPETQMVDRAETVVYDVSIEAESLGYRMRRRVSRQPGRDPEFDR
jgi:hypothetical protein